MLKQKRGITLVALVVTIIILLILAGVSINFIFGNEGIFNKTQIAAEKYRQAQNDEQAMINEVQNYVKDGYSVGNNSRNNKYYNLEIGDDLIAWINSSSEKLNLTFEDVINSSIFNKLINDEQALEHMLGSQNILNEVMKSNTAMKKIFSTSTVMDKVIKNDKWRTAILGNDNAIAILDETNPTVVPIMTSNTTPSGEAFASSSYTTYSIFPYRVFDGNTGGEDYWDPAAGAVYKDQYIGYSFTSPIWVYKIYVNTETWAGYLGKQKMHFIIEATNTKDNDNSWVAISEEKSEGEHTIIVKNDNKTKYQHYRARITKTDGDTVQSGSGNSGFKIMQFYGK